ncbi:MAG: 2'-5' RNA ligase family protein [Saprospiraceae bacterium]|nr:2'-5' RNA ligase family protein [Saprospiraceae bacterium]
MNPEPEKGTKKLFFIALLVKGDFAEVVRSLQEEMCEQFAACQSLKSPPHITLIPPFGADPNLSKDMVELCSSHQLEDLSGKAGSVDHFDDRVIFLSVEKKNEWTRLRKPLKASLKELGIKASIRQTYHPHITLGHKNLQPKFQNAWDYFKDREIDAIFEISQPVLLHHNGQLWVVVD